MSTDENLELMKEITNKLSNLIFKVEELSDSLNRVEMLNYIRTYHVLGKNLANIFKNPKQILAYELSNGEKSTREIGNIVDVDQKTISIWWRDWESNFHIVEKVGKRGQYKKRYSLFELLIRFSPEEFSLESLNKD